MRSDERSDKIRKRTPAVKNSLHPLPYFISAWWLFLIPASYPAAGYPYPATPAGYPPAGRPMITPARSHPVTGALFVPAASYHPFAFYPYLASSGRRGAMVISRGRRSRWPYFNNDLRRTCQGDCHKKGNHNDYSINVLFHELDFSHWNKKMVPGLIAYT